MDQRSRADGAGGPAPSEGPWREVAAGVHVLVAEPDGVNLGLVVGTDAALLVDTGSSPAQGRRVRAAVARLTDVPLVSVVVTHGHSDHLFGLAAFDDLASLGHESIRSGLGSAETAAAAGGLGLTAEHLRAPSRELAVAASVDLGGTRVEVAHLGSGHTAGDLVVVVPGADVLFVGDLVESAGPPWYGPDSRPHEWPATLDAVIGLMTATTRAVPGHGEPVDREFVFEARGRVAAVSGELTRLVESGVAEADALGAGTWAYPAAHVRGGLAPGYAALADRAVKGTRPTLPLA